MTHHFTWSLRSRWRQTFIRPIDDHRSIPRTFWRRQSNRAATFLFEWGVVSEPNKEYQDSHSSLGRGQIAKQRCQSNCLHTRRSCSSHLGTAAARGALLDGGYCCMAILNDEAVLTRNRILHINVRCECLSSSGTGPFYRLDNTGHVADCISISDVLLLSPESMLWSLLVNSSFLSYLYSGRLLAFRH